MDLLQKRANTRTAVLEKRFIQKVLREEGRDLDKEMLKRMSTFSAETKVGRNISVQNTELLYRHRAVHRFIDMKTRETRRGKIKKKRHLVHNAPLFGYANNIVRRISFGFTEQVKREMMELDGEEL